MLKRNPTEEPLGTADVRLFYTPEALLIIQPKVTKHRKINCPCDKYIHYLLLPPS